MIYAFFINSLRQFIHSFILLFREHRNDGGEHPEEEVERPADQPQPGATERRAANQLRDHDQ